jgi:hypothetical protein
LDATCPSKEEAAPTAINQPSKEIYLTQQGESAPTVINSARQRKNLTPTKEIRPTSENPDLYGKYGPLQAKTTSPQENSAAK